MLSNQIIQTNMDQLKGITKGDFFVYDMEGDCIVATGEEVPFDGAVIDSFVASQADSQIVAGCHFLKVYDENELTYVLIARGLGNQQTLNLAYCHLPHHICIIAKSSCNQHIS